MAWSLGARFGHNFECCSASASRHSPPQVVHNSIVEKVLEHNGKGRVIVTQFASNLHRLYGVKRAADASGRKICFVGESA
jgi:mRNA degradation ribonuclease J1/J2